MDDRAEPHPLSDVWPRCYAMVLELWRLARPAIEERAAARGVPLALYDYVELGLDTLSVAEAQRRDPYSRPDGLAAELARLAAAGWLELLEGRNDPAALRYAVLPRAREEVRGLGVAGDARLGTLALLPAADLERLHELLARIAAANLAAPEPPAPLGDAAPLPGRRRRRAAARSGPRARARPLRLPRRRSHRSVASARRPRNRLRDRGRPLERVHARLVRRGS